MKQDPFPRRPVDVVVPDLGAGAEAIRFNTWLAPRGSHVIPGERIAELIAEGTLFQLDAPAEGRLEALRATAGDLVRPGDVIARIRPEAS